MDDRTARDAARIRGWAAVGAGVLGVLLAALCTAFALTAPADARPLLWVAVALALVGALACAALAAGNRRLAVDPRDPRPLARVALVPVGVLLAWAAAVVVVLALTRDLAWTLAALGLVTLTLPAVVLALVTRKGPHPA